MKKMTDNITTASVQGLRKYIDFDIRHRVASRKLEQPCVTERSEACSVFSLFIVGGWGSRVGGTNIYQRIRI